MACNNKLIQMKKKELLNNFESNKEENFSLVEKEKKLSKSEKKEIKNNNLVFIFTNDENKSKDNLIHYYKQGTLTQDITKRSKEALNINNNYISINSIADYIEEDGNEDDQLENFNINKFTTNYNNKK